MWATHKKSVLFPLLLLATLVVAFLLYKPGAKGDFYFDDYANLNQLQILSVHGYSLQGFLIYIDRAPGGVLKRPVATLSFLLDAHLLADPVA
jgi:hypothetical protein